MEVINSNTDLYNLLLVTSNIHHANHVGSKATNLENQKSLGPIYSQGFERRRKKSKSLQSAILHSLPQNFKGNVSIYDSAE